MPVHPHLFLHLASAGFRQTVALMSQGRCATSSMADYVYVFELGRNKFEVAASEFTNLEKAFWV